LNAYYCLLFNSIGLGLGLGLVFSWLVILHTYLYFLLSFSLSPKCLPNAWNCLGSTKVIHL